MLSLPPALHSDAAPLLAAGAQPMSSIEQRWKLKGPLIYDAGDFQWGAEKSKIPWLRATNEMIVRVKAGYDPEKLARKLTGPGGPLPRFVLLEIHEETLLRLARPGGLGAKKFDAVRKTVKRFEGVEWAAPTFVGSNGSRAYTNERVAVTLNEGVDARAFFAKWVPGYTFSDVPLAAHVFEVRGGSLGAVKLAATLGALPEVQNAAPEFRGEIAPAGPLAYDAGDFHWGEDKSKIRLLRATNEMIVRVKAGYDPEEVARKLTGPGGPLPSFVLLGIQDGTLLRLTRLDGLEAEKFEAVRKAVTRFEGVEWAAPTFVTPEGSRTYADERVIVALNEGVDARSFFAKWVPDYQFEDVPRVAFVLTAPGGGLGAMKLAARLGALPEVRYAEPNMYVQMTYDALPSDTLIADQWNVDNTAALGGVAGADARLSAAWDVTTGSPDVVIAVLDCGVDLVHRDLRQNIYVNPNEIAGNGQDDDNNGYVDDVNGWDFVSWDNDPSPATAYDDHGTAVAGVAAATRGNWLGIAGVSQAKILPIKISQATRATPTGPLSAGFVDNNTLARAVYYMAGREVDANLQPTGRTWRGADVAVCSWGAQGNAAAVLATAFEWASTSGRDGRGVSVFASAGNEASAYESRKFLMDNAPAGTYRVRVTYTRADAVGNPPLWDPPRIGAFKAPDGSISDFRDVTGPGGWELWPAGFASGWQVEGTPFEPSPFPSGAGAFPIVPQAIGAGQTAVMESPVFQYPGVSPSTFDDEIRFSWVPPASLNDSLRVELIDAITRASVASWPTISGAIRSVTYSGVKSVAKLASTIAVGASTEFDLRAQYSQFGQELDLVAPGGGAGLDIITTDRMSAAGYNTRATTNDDSAGDYTTGRFALNGTSFAAPLAAGVAALLLSRNPDLSATSIRDMLRNSAAKVGGVTYVNGRHDEYGYGRIDARAALDLVTADVVGPSITGYSIDLGENGQKPVLTYTFSEDTFWNSPLAIEIRNPLNQVVTPESARGAGTRQLRLVLPKLTVGGTYTVRLRNWGFHDQTWQSTGGNERSNTLTSDDVRQFTLNIAVPAAPTGVTLAAGYDTGNGQAGTLTDGVTKIMQPTMLVTLAGATPSKIHVKVCTAGTTNAFMTVSVAVQPGATSVAVPLTQALADGAYDVYAFAEGSNGTFSADTAVYRLTIDATKGTANAAVKAFQGKPLIWSNKTPSLTSVSVRRVVKKKPSTVGTVVASKGTWKISDSGYKAAWLNSGQIKYQSRYTDPAGNVTAWSASALYGSTRKSNTRSVAISGIGDWGPDLGNGAHTTDHTLVIHGFTAPYEEVSVILDGVGEVGTTTAGARGLWKFDCSSVILPDGTHVLAAESYVNGDWSTSAPFTVHVGGPSLPLLVPRINGAVVYGPLPAQGYSLFSGASASSSEGEFIENGGLTRLGNWVFVGTAMPGAKIRLRTATGSVTDPVDVDYDGQWSFEYVPDSLASGNANDFIAEEVTGSGTPEDPYVVSSEPSASFRVVYDADVPELEHAFVEMPEDGFGADRIVLHFTDDASGSAISLGDFVLRRDGVVVPWTGQTLDVGDGFDWMITGLSDITAAPGSYSLSLESGEIVDEAGNVMANDGSPLFRFGVVVGTSSADTFRVREGSQYGWIGIDVNGLPALDLPQCRLSQVLISGLEGDDVLLDELPDDLKPSETLVFDGGDGTDRVELGASSYFSIDSSEDGTAFMSTYGARYYEYGQVESIALAAPADSVHVDSGALSISSYVGTLTLNGGTANVLPGLDSVSLEVPPDATGTLNIASGHSLALGWLVLPAGATLAISGQVAHYGVYAEDAMLSLADATVTGDNNVYLGGLSVAEGTSNTLSVTPGNSVSVRLSTDIAAGAALALTGGQLVNNGTIILGDGASLSSTMTILNHGVLRNADGAAAIVLTGLDTDGTVEVHGGRIDLQGAVPQLSGTTLAGGTWRVENGILAFNPGGLGACSQITQIGAGAVVRLGGVNGVIDDMDLVSNAGSLTIAAGQNLTAPATFTNTGTLTVESGGSFTASAGFIQSGTLTGTGTLALPSGNLVLNNPVGQHVVLKVFGTDGVDAVLVRLKAGDPAIAQIVINGVARDFPAVNPLAIDTGLGADTITLDYSNGNPFAVAGVSALLTLTNPGSDIDILIASGTSAAVAVRPLTLSSGSFQAAANLGTSRSLSLDVAAGASTSFTASQNFFALSSAGTINASAVTVTATTFTLTGGSLTTAATAINAGGSFSNSSAAHTISGHFYLETPYTLDTDGSLNVGGNLYLGLNAAGSITQFSGSVAIGSRLYMGFYAGGTGTYDLQSGSLNGV